MPGKKVSTEKVYQYTPLRKPGEPSWEATRTPTESGDKDEQLPSRAKESDEVTVSDELPVESNKLNKDGENIQQAEKGQDLGDLEENNQEAQCQIENIVLGATEEAKKPTQYEEQKDSQNTEADVTDESLSRNTLENTPSVETKSTENVTTVITLNPNAAEFVPGAGLTLSSVVDVPDFLPESFELKERPPLLRKQLSTHETELENFVKDVLFGLTESPGELVEYVSLLANMLKKWLNELASLKDTVDLIFEYSITEPNFQYIAARLCNSLSMRKDLCLPDREKFRDIFLNRCKDEHVNREKSLQDPDKISRVFGFAMFLGELFCNYRPLGETQPLKVFHRGLVEMLTTLLNYGKEDALSCVGKILKMTGFLLDDPSFKEDKERESKVNNVFSDVEQLSKESTVPESVRELLSQVMDLRAINWGMVGPNTSQPFTLPEESGEVYFSEVTYGLDGIALDDYLTPVTHPDQWNDYYDQQDEELYTSTNVEVYSYYFPDQDYQAYSSEDGEHFYGDEDPALDDEIDAEFEKFLQEQENALQ